MDSIELQFKITFRMIRFLVFVLSFLLFNTSFAQHYSTNELQLIKEINDVLKDNHVEYENIYPKINSRITNCLLNELDPDSKYLTENEYIKIDSLLTGFTLQDRFTSHVLEVARELYKNRLTATLNILNSLGSLDFFEEDSALVSINSNIALYSEDDKALKDRWENILKLRILTRYKGDSLTIGLSNDELNSLLNTKLKLEIASEICKVEMLLTEQHLSRDVLSAYLKSFCKSFDPHTNFLLNQEDNDFRNSLASEFYGTGISFGQDGGYFFVTAIQPLSSASSENEITVGDEITGVVLDGRLVSPACLSLYELNSLFYGEDNTSLELELRSSNDKLYRRFKLSKRMVNNAINHTYSFVLTDNDLKLGYILFPSFYAPKGANGRSSAQDLALILLEMNKKKVDGIIMDLRNNGGGSIIEAADLLGYFIDYGPLFSISTQDNLEGVLVKDTKKGKLVNNRVIFLVNALSASASEIVAATMQKYPNTLIVGSSTFGKATGQTLIPIKSKYTNKSEGTVIVTNIKVFRFNGTSYQKEGVVPDIQLPTIINKSLFSEADYKNVLEPGSARAFHPIQYRNEPIDSLNILVTERENLLEIEAQSKLLEAKFSDSLYISLQYDKFSDVLESLRENQFKKAETFEIVPLEDNEVFLNESNQIKLHKEKDPILNEVFIIFRDWIEIQNSN